jgi:1,4-dihydroxy-2-naphthoate octaprenyltransferase
LNLVGSSGGNITESNLNRLSVWWKALRYHFVPPSIFPATLGALVAWAVDHTFYPFYFLLVLVGVIANHIALNMADDYFDFKHAVDHLTSEEKNPYSGGSGTLSGGLIRPSAMFKAFVLCFASTITIGLYLTILRGVPVLLFGLLGVFCSVFYTAPPISFSHHGLGELGQLVCFGTVIGMGSYFVQTQKLTLEAFLATLPLGIMLFSMIIINEIPDYEQDRLAGKFTLVARYGKWQGAKLYMASWVCTYSVIMCGIVFGVLPLTVLLSLVSLPLALRSIQTLRVNYENPLKLAPANLDMIRAHSLMALGLIAAYSIQGILEGAPTFQLLTVLVLLALSYVPAVLTPKQQRNS